MLMKASKQSLSSFIFQVIYVINVLNVVTENKRKLIFRFTDILIFNERTEYRDI